jgi:hypothetical protein
MNVVRDTVWEEVGVALGEGDLQVFDKLVLW